MASSYLVVRVYSAEVPSSSNTTSATRYYYVELRFGDQIERTKKKENPRWDNDNGEFSFPMREHEGGDADHDTSDVVENLFAKTGRLYLEAAVYSIDDDETSNKSLVGKAVVEGKYFQSHSSKAIPFVHDLLKSNGGVNGKLTLKVFHSAANESSLFEKIDDDSLFSDKPGSTSSVVVGTTKNFALRPPCDDVPRVINPSFDRGEVVERMEFLFVLVVKARELPGVDAYGRLDPFVGVKFDGYNELFTKIVERAGDNPEWNETFAFLLRSSSGVHVIVKHKDVLRDEFVGKLYFNPKDIPVRHRDEAQPVPTWHPLLDQGGKATVGKASLLLAIWIGSQADEAYRHAWVNAPYGPKVYENPRLWCLRVTIFEVNLAVVECDEDEAGGGTTGANRSLRVRDKLFCRARLLEDNAAFEEEEEEEEDRKHVRKTRLASKTTRVTSSCRYEWEEEDLVFVAPHPAFGSKLEVHVVSVSDSEEEEVIGQLSVPLVSIDKRAAAAYDCETLATPTPQWFVLEKPSPSRPHPHLDGSADEAGVGGGSGVSHMRIRLRSVLDGGYHIGHDPLGYMDDTRPAERQLWEEPPIGRLHLGILRGTGLKNMASTKDGRRKSGGELKPYCVAKYGDKWVRTRTVLGSSDPVFNEQYTWDVYDIATVLDVGVFDRCSLKASSDHHRIGKVRIHLSSLETDRIYAHAYPLINLSSSGSGVIKTGGELQLAVKISSPSTMTMLRMYARPTLPRMHYAQPLEEEQAGHFLSATRSTLWSDAADMLALRLDRLEPPLSREVVAYLCNAKSCNNNSSWSLRRSKANFYRLTRLLSPLIYPLRWFDGVICWRNPLVTLLAHAILVLALWFHELVPPLVLVWVALVGMWNYRSRPMEPSYVDLLISHAADGLVHPDELDEEFNTDTRLWDEDLLRMRYDRLRSVAGRVQTVIGDMATQLERIQSLLTWRYPTATAIFMIFLLVAAAVVYFVPYKILIALAGFYVMRHPRLRRRENTTSMLVCFFRRLPSRDDELL